MTIAATEDLKSGPYTGNGVTVDFDYDFSITQDSDLVVTRRNADETQTVLTLTTDYTVVDAGVAGGGNITLVDAASNPTGATLTLSPDIPLDQTRPFGAQTSITLTEIENALDKLTSIVRQVKELNTRAILLPVDSVADTQMTEGDTERANAFLAFGATGEPYAAAGVAETAVSAFMATVLDDVSAAAAKVTLEVTPTALGLLIGTDVQAYDPLLSYIVNAEWSDGDVMYYDASGYLTRLPIGTAGQALVTNSGADAPEWGVAAVATETVAGPVEKATTAEAEAGTEADKFPDVVGVADAIVALNPFMNNLLHVQATYAANVDGGSTSSGAWNTRPVNTTVLNEIVGASRSSSQITLPAGDYIIMGWSILYESGRSAIRLYDTTGAAVLLDGHSTHMHTSQAVGSSIPVVGRFTLAVESVLELEYRVDSSQGTNGLGYSNSWGPNNYCDLLFWKA